MVWRGLARLTDQGVNTLSDGCRRLSSAASYNLTFRRAR